MQRLQSVSPENASGKAKELLDNIQKSIGMVPNIFKIMSNSPAALDAQLKFKGALSAGTLSPKLRELIALYVSELNECHYCLAAHSAISSKQGLSEEEITNARRGISNDDKEAAALKFVGKTVNDRAKISDDDISALHAAGYNDGEIVEIIANISMSIFTNYFNHIADPQVDFPEAKPLI